MRDELTASEARHRSAIAEERDRREATFTLAETYNPLVLATWRTYGTRGDATKARELYAKAYAGGIQEAKDRYDALVLGPDGGAKRARSKVMDAERAIRR